MICKKCGSPNVTVQLVEKQKRRGLLASILWILLAICTCGLILLIPLLTRKGSKTQKWLVCNDCGYSRRI